jgi:hypothetical protein
MSCLKKVILQNPHGPTINKTIVERVQPFLQFPNLSNYHPQMV